MRVVDLKFRSLATWEGAACGWNPKTSRAKGLSRLALDPISILTAARIAAGDVLPGCAPLSRDRIMAAKTSFRGSFTALVTPFKNGSVDEKAFRALVDWQIAEGTNGLVPVGTTGESPTLSHEEHKDVVEWCVDQARAAFRSWPAPARIRPGRRSNSPSMPKRPAPTPCWSSRPITTSRPRKGSISTSRRSTMRSAFRSSSTTFRARSVVDMSVDTMKRLYELKNIAGVKDATANMARVSQQRAAMGEDFNQLSGEDITALGFMAHGGHGCISVTSNVAPRLCAEFQAACLKGDYAAALKLQDKLAPLHIDLFVETSRRRSSMRCRCSASAPTRCGCPWCRRARRRRPPCAKPWCMPA